MGIGVPTAPGRSLGASNGKPQTAALQVPPLFLSGSSRLNNSSVLTESTMRFLRTLVWVFAVCRNSWMPDFYGFQLLSCRASPRERAGKKPQTCYGRQHHSRQATCSASIAGLPALLDEHPGGVLQPQKLKRQTVAAGGLLSALHRHCSGTGAPDFSETLLTSPCTAQARLVPGSWQAAMARLSRLCL